MNENQLWQIYNELLHNWQGYIIIVARSKGIDKEDLFDAVLAHIIEYKDTNIKRIIFKKATELYYRKEVPFSKLETDDEETNIIERLEFKTHKEEETKESPLDKLPEDLKEYLLARIRIEKALPLSERIKFRQKLKEAQRILGGLN